MRDDAAGIILRLYYLHGSSDIVPTNLVFVLYESGGDNDTLLRRKDLI